MRYAWFAVFVIGCYEAPDYSGTHFKCDSEHACPSGQPCVNGVCGGMGSGSNMIDAPPASTGVLCGSIVCGATQKCCADLLNGPTCLAPSASCTGFAATCDGVEDCGTGRCCETGSITIACAPTCAGYVICRENADCPANVPACCAMIGTMEPWGRCMAACP